MKFDAAAHAQIAALHLCNMKPPTGLLLTANDLEQWGQIPPFKLPIYTSGRDGRTSARDYEFCVLQFREELRELLATSMGRWLHTVPGGFHLLDPGRSAPAVVERAFKKSTSAVHRGSRVLNVLCEAGLTQAEKNARIEAENRLAMLRHHTRNVNK